MPLEMKRWSKSRSTGEPTKWRKVRTCSMPDFRSGLDIPYFCWHPAMGSVGACRLCAVKQYKDEDDTEGTDRHVLHDGGRRTV